MQRLNRMDVSSWDKPVLEEMNASIRAVASFRQTHGFCSPNNDKTIVRCGGHGDGASFRTVTRTVTIPSIPVRSHRPLRSPMTAWRSPWDREERLVHKQEDTGWFHTLIWVQSIFPPMIHRGHCGNRTFFPERFRSLRSWV